MTLVERLNALATDMEHGADDRWTYQERRVLLREAADHIRELELRNAILRKQVALLGTPEGEP